MKKTKSNFQHNQPQKGRKKKSSKKAQIYQCKIQWADSGDRYKENKKK